MATVIDIFFLVVDAAKRDASPIDPLNSPAHPLNSPAHPLRSPAHPLRSPTHPLNSALTPNLVIARLHALQGLLQEYFPR